MKIRADKLGRIYAITEEDSYITPMEFKETLNMFRGRQLKTNAKECIKYLKLSLAKQKGDYEAERELNNIHKSWNFKRNSHEYFRTN